MVLRLTPAGGPLGWDLTLRFLAARAIPGVEEADPDAGVFRRGTVDGVVTMWADGDALMVDSQTDGAASVADLDTDIEAVARHLATADPELKRRLADHPLPRLPGCFDRFELVMRAVIGQQVSVAAARTTLGSLVALADPDRAGLGPFPSAAQVAAGPLDRLGVPGRKRDCVRMVAEMVADGGLDLDADPEEVEAALLAVSGIGPWTVGYVLMRAYGRADRWPVNDLVLRQNLGVDNRELARRAETWHPWQAYGAMLVWATG